MRINWKKDCGPKFVNPNLVPIQHTGSYTWWSSPECIEQCGFMKNELIDELCQIPRYNLSNILYYLENINDFRATLLIRYLKGESLSIIAAFASTKYKVKIPINPARICGMLCNVAEDVIAINNYIARSFSPIFSNLPDDVSYVNWEPHRFIYALYEATKEKSAKEITLAFNRKMLLNVSGIGKKSAGIICDVFAEKGFYIEE